MTQPELQEPDSTLSRLDNASGEYLLVRDFQVGLNRSHKLTRICQSWLRRVVLRKRLVLYWSGIIHIGFQRAQLGY